MRGQGGGGGRADGKGPAATPVPHHEDHPALRLAAHPALQHARWQVIHALYTYELLRRGIVFRAYDVPQQQISFYVYINRIWF